MNKLLVLFAFVLMSFITASCSSDEEDMGIPASSSKEPFRAMSEEKITDSELIVAYGYDRIESKKKIKLALTKDAAEELGLPQGVYVEEFLLCSKNVDCKPGYDVWGEKSENCGFIPSMDFVLGNKGLLMEKTRGYALPYSNGHELRTFVIHIMSGMSEHKVNSYYPCNPKDIEWRYSIAPQEASQPI